MPALPTVVFNPQWRVIGIGIPELIAGGAFATVHDWRMPILSGLDGLWGGGVVRYHNACSFTAAYRRIIVNCEAPDIHLSFTYNHG